MVDVPSRLMRQHGMWRSLSIDRIFKFQYPTRTIVNNNVKGTSRPLILSNGGNERSRQAAAGVCSSVGSASVVIAEEIALAPFVKRHACILHSSISKNHQV